MQGAAKQSAGHQPHSAKRLVEVVGGEAPGPGPERDQDRRPVLGLDRADRFNDLLDRLVEGLQQPLASQQRPVEGPLRQPLPAMIIPSR